jgi:hypothetical protein
MPPPPQIGFRLVHSGTLALDAQACCAVASSPFARASQEPFAPTKFGRENKHPAATPGAFFFAGAVCAASNKHVAAQRREFKSP